MSTTHEHLDAVRALYGAYERRDRGAVEVLLSDDFRFCSLVDVDIDRARYFERCWPNSENLRTFQFLRLVAHDHEVLVTYECTRTDNSRFRNTEVPSVRGGQICRAEVYFGWNLGD